MRNSSKISTLEAKFPLLAAEQVTVDWDDVVFEVDLLKSQEIDIDFILELLFEHHQKTNDKEVLVEEVRRIIRSSMGHRAKEELIVDFIHTTDLSQLEDKEGVIEAFFAYAQGRQRTEAAQLLAEEQLNEEAARRYLRTSLKNQYASDNGTALNACLPKMSPLNPHYRTKKQTVFQKIVAFVERFKGIGGEV